MEMEKLSFLEEKLKIKFKDKNLLKQALIHRSYINEHSNFRLEHNERLEFLGDAVLELIITKFLYNNFDSPEGELTSFRASLVNTKSLAKISRKLKINQYLYLSKGEEKHGRSRDAILANAFEALIGAIYLDQGLTVAEKFIHQNLIPCLKKILENKSYKDPKSIFQEVSQSEFKITPTYKIINESGPDHAKKFKVGVFLKEKMITFGIGRNKQEAELRAAKKALQKK
ncbi:MAG: ribonuclease III [Patescibacteria group bacterium]|jgi:ribonuclease-3|nr:ribonuclease III [Patescibacteria group bacterium]MDD5172598.1 ribonuclease III [Patescibacteria group bacterium]